MAEINIPYNVPEYIQNGEPVDESVANRPAKQIQENVLAIKYRAELDIDNLNALIGFPALYDSSKTYNKNDIVADSSGNRYISLQDDNIGNALTDTTWWKPFKLSVGGQLVVADSKPDSTNNEPYNTVWINELTKDIFYQISEDETNPEWIKVGGSGNLDNKSLLYYFQLYLSSFNYVTFEAFKGEPLTLTTTTGTYNYDTQTLDVSTNDTIVTDNILSASASTFKIIVDTTVTDITVEYSIDGGNTYTTVNDPYYIELDSSVNDFRIKITFNADGTVNGWGVLWDEAGYPSSTAFKLLEIYTSQGEQAGDYITIPNDKVYTPDGKSLEVYLNGVLQNLGDFYEEDSSGRQIKLLKNTQSGDIIVFREYIGSYTNNVLEDITDKVLKGIDTYNDYVVTSDYNARIREYIYGDSTNGSFTITLPDNPANGDVIKILDVAGSFNTNNVTVNGNGKNIMGDSTATLDISNAEYELIFVGPNNEWRLVV